MQLLEARIDNVIYTCGASEQLFDDGHPLKKKVYIKSALTCGMPVEKAYYTVGKFEICCTWCGETDASRLVDLTTLELGGKKGYSICTDCHGRGFDVVTHGQAIKTGAAAKKAKGKQRAAQHKGKQAAAAKRARRVVVDSSDESEEEEEEGEEEEGEEEDADDEEEDGAEAEAARWGSGAGQMEEGIWTVERILAKEERGTEGTFYLVDWEGWSLGEASWEPLSNILTANAEVRIFEETLAAMPRLDAFTALSSSGCCFGKLCKFPNDKEMAKEPCASCGLEHHHLCASENPFLKWIGPEKIEGRKCFDCWLLEAQLRKTVHPLQVAGYYKQLADWSHADVKVTLPFAIGSFLSTSAIPLQPVVKTTERARLPPVSGKCKKCKKGGELLACSFCAAVFHNSEACLGEDKMEGPLAKSPSFPWACPACFKKGIAGVQRAVLKPTVQRSTRAKRKQRA